MRTLLASGLKTPLKLAGAGPTGMPFNTPFVYVAALVDSHLFMVPPHSAVAWSPRANYEAAARC